METTLVTGVAGNAYLLNFKQQRIAITIQRDR
jgi:hypothetical protein